MRTNSTYINPYPEPFIIYLTKGEQDCIWGCKIHICGTSSEQSVVKCWFFEEMAATRTAEISIAIIYFLSCLKRMNTASIWTKFREAKDNFVPQTDLRVLRFNNLIVFNTAQLRITLHNYETLKLEEIKLM